MEKQLTQTRKKARIVGRRVRKRRTSTHPRNYDQSTAVWYNLYSKINNVEKEWECSFPRCETAVAAAEAEAIVQGNERGASG
jgi:hypothetical protein